MVEHCKTTSLVSALVGYARRARRVVDDIITTETGIMFLEVYASIEDGPLDSLEVHLDNSLGSVFS